MRLSPRPRRDDASGGGRSQGSRRLKPCGSAGGEAPPSGIPPDEALAMAGQKKGLTWKMGMSSRKDPCETAVAGGDRDGASIEPRTLGLFWPFERSQHGADQGESSKETTGDQLGVIAGRFHLVEMQK